MAPPPIPAAEDAERVSNLHRWQARMEDRERELMVRVERAVVGIERAAQVIGDLADRVGRIEEAQAKRIAREAARAALWRGLRWWVAALAAGGSTTAAYLALWS